MSDEKPRVGDLVAAFHAHNPDDWKRFAGAWVVIKWDDWYESHPELVKDFVIVWRKP